MPRKRAKDNAEDLVSHVFMMGRLMRDAIHRQVANSRFSLLELEALRYVKESGRPYMREIARNFHVTPPAATLMIDGLVKAKLLARVLDAKDRRSVRITITPKGRKVLEKGNIKKANGVKKLFAVLTPAERAEFIAIIRKIIKDQS